MPPRRHAPVPGGLRGGQGRRPLRHRSLPDLPFEDGQFDLALVSHLLFLYSEQLDFDFHRAAVEELLRVAREVRIFPLLTLERRPSPHVGPICTHVARRGWKAEVCVVPYEFRRGSNEMLRIVNVDHPRRFAASRE